MKKIFNSFLRKHGLTKDVSYEINETQEDILQLIKKNSSEDYYSSIFSVFDFTTSKTFISSIKKNHFKLRLKQKSFTLFKSIAYLDGVVVQKENKSLVSITIHGTRIMVIIMKGIITIILSLLFTLFTVAFLFSPMSVIEYLQNLFIILLIASIFILVPAIMARKGIKYLKEEFEHNIINR